MEIYFQLVTVPILSIQQSGKFLPVFTYNSAIIPKNACNASRSFLKRSKVNQSSQLEITLLAEQL
jgi:hypothetical protein